MPNIFGKHLINPVGKYFNESIYVHKDYAHILSDKINLDVLQERMSHLPDDFEFDIIRYDRIGRDDYVNVTFISVPDFDTARAPMNAGSWSIKGPGYIEMGYGNHRYTKQKKDPQVYLDKWMYVMSDYEGFNWDHAFLWSERWRGYAGGRENLTTLSRWNSFLKKHKTLGV